MKPMLARTLGPKFTSFPCYVQPKLNGVRALYQAGIEYDGTYAGACFQSRDEKQWGANILDHLVKELHSIFNVTGDLILDGELYVHGWRLQDINAAIAVNRKESSEKTKDVEFHMFDVVDPKKSFGDRWIGLMRNIRDTNLPHIKTVETAYIHDRVQLDVFFEQYISMGYEGIMLRPDGPYEFGEHLGRGRTMTQFRSKFLWKHKSWLDDEFRCVGFTEGKGKADIGVGALVLASAPQFNQRFSVGTGLTDSDRIEFAKNPPIGKLVKIRYLCLTTDGIPFNPSFLAVLD